MRSVTLSPTSRDGRAFPSGSDRARLAHCCEQRLELVATIVAHAVHEERRRAVDTTAHAAHEVVADLLLVPVPGEVAREPARIEAEPRGGRMQVIGADRLLVLVD